MLTSTAQVRLNLRTSGWLEGCRMHRLAPQRCAFGDDRCEMEDPYACGEAIWERPARAGAEPPGARHDGTTISSSPPACIRCSLCAAVVQPFFGLQPTFCLQPYLCNNALQQNPRKAGGYINQHVKRVSRHPIGVPWEIRNGGTLAGGSSALAARPRAAPSWGMMIFYYY